MSYILPGERMMPMAKTAMINARIEPKLKKEVEGILSS
jgi:hypothetical protein